VPLQRSGFDRAVDVSVSPLSCAFPVFSLARGRKDQQACEAAPPANAHGIDPMPAFRRCKTFLRSFPSWPT